MRRRENGRVNQGKVSLPLERGWVQSPPRTAKYLAGHCQLCVKPARVSVGVSVFLSPDLSSRSFCLW